MQSFLNRAHTCALRAVELQCPVGPNLEEICAVTLQNFEVGKQAARSLGISSGYDLKLVKRYLYTFCNLYWVKQLDDAQELRGSTMWEVITDAVSKMPAEEALNRRNVRLATFRRPSEMGPGDMIVIIDPRLDDVWKKGMRLYLASQADGDGDAGGMLIFMNSQLNERYGLAGWHRGKLSSVTVAYL